MMLRQRRPSLRSGIWTPQVHGEEEEMRRVLADVDLEPFALVRIPGVAGAFGLEYADSYSAASAVLALDRVDPKRKVLQAQDGLEVRAAEWHSDQQCFKEEAGHVPMGLRKGMPNALLWWCPASSRKSPDRWRRRPPATPRLRSSRATANGFA